MTGFVFVTSSASSVAAGALVPVCAEGVGTAALPLQLCAGLGFSRGSVLSWRRNWDGGSLPPPVVLHNVSCSSGGAAGSGGSAGVGLLAADAAEAACVAVPAYDGYCFEVARVTCSGACSVIRGGLSVHIPPCLLQCWLVMSCHACA